MQSLLGADDAIRKLGAAGRVRAQRQSRNAKRARERQTIDRFLGHLAPFQINGNRTLLVKSAIGRVYTDRL